MKCSGHDQVWTPGKIVMFGPLVRFGVWRIFTTFLVYLYSLVCCLCACISLCLKAMGKSEEDIDFCSFNATLRNANNKTKTPKNLSYFMSLLKRASDIGYRSTTKRQVYLHWFEIAKLPAMCVCICDFCMCVLTHVCAHARVCMYDKHIFIYR